MGEAIARHGMRDSLVLATKVHGLMRRKPNGSGLSRKAIMSRNFHVVSMCSNGNGGGDG